MSQNKIKQVIFTCLITVQCRIQKTILLIVFLNNPFKKTTGYKNILLLLIVYFVLYCS